MKCKNCRNYDEILGRLSSTDEPQPTGYGYCKAVAHAERPNKGSAVVMDGSGYWATLRVDENFGCVLFDDILKEYRENVNTNVNTKA